MHLHSAVALATALFTAGTVHAALDPDLRVTLNGYRDAGALVLEWDEPLGVATSYQVFCLAEAGGKPRRLANTRDRRYVVADPDCTEYRVRALGIGPLATYLVEEPDLGAGNPADPADADDSGDPESSETGRGLEGRNGGDLPRWTINDLEYIGAARFPKANAGVSSFKSSGPKLALRGDSGWATGKWKPESVARISLPSLVDSTDLGALNFVSVTQGFVPALKAAETGNPQGIDQILGLYEHEGRLIVNAERFYDGDGDNTHTTLVFDDATNLTAPRGFYELKGAARVAKWIGEVPAEWRDALGTEHFMGNAGCGAIRSRGTFGPSFYAVDLDGVLGASLSNPSIATTELMGYDLQTPLHPDPKNENGGNDLWTYKSCAEYAFIVPGTSTYLVLGHSGGHESGIGYKITQDDGNVCGGYCPRSASDVYNRYWAFDVNDLVAVRLGERDPSSLQPYEYGDLDVPFQPGSGANVVSGGTFDVESGRLCLTVQDADATQSRYSTLPALACYQIGR